MSNQGVTYKTDKIMPTWEQLAEMGRESPISSKRYRTTEGVDPRTGNAFQQRGLYQKVSRFSVRPKSVNTVNTSMPC